MPEEARKRLEEVHGQLSEAAGAGDTEASELADQVGAFLADDEQADADHEALLDRLREGVRRFEASHPTLSEAVQRVVDSLTASGI
jgi:hypothetical protein